MSQYDHITPGFPRCSAAESDCPLQQTCLRSLAWREPGDDYFKATILPMVNYHCEALDVASGHCAMYRTSEKLRFARGMSRLFDDVPQRLLATITKQVIALFSSRRAFYYCKEGTQLTTPAQQQALADLFASYNLTLPPFDGYEERYDWS